MMSCFILKPFELLEQCTFGVALAQNAFQRFKTSSDLNGTVGTPHFVAGHIYIYAKNPFQRFKSLNFKHLLYYIYMIYVDHFLLSQLPLGGHPRHTGARKSFSIYEKLQAIREVDRLVEEGVTSGIQKRVMETFKHMFAGSKGYKSGVLGRWLTQADAQKWREIPFERMSAADRSMKELPDWARIPLGMRPRSLERFRDGKQVPACVVTSLVKIVERLMCGAEDSPLTCGNLSVKNLQAEANRLLKSFWEAQEEANPDIKIPKKMEVSEKWINRFLDKNGWTRRAPNTCGAYLEYDDERMQRSRQTFSFPRIGQEVPLALCVNFDQIWRQTWPDPKRVLLRFSNCSVNEFLSSKRRQALQEWPTCSKLMHHGQSREGG